MGQTTAQFTVPGSENIVNARENFFDRDAVHVLLAERRVLLNRVTDREVRVILVREDATVFAAGRPEGKPALAKERDHGYPSMCSVFLVFCGT